MKLSIERTGSHEFAMIFAGPLAVLMERPDCAKRVYMFLCLKAKGSRRWYCTAQAIAEGTGVSERSVWRGLRDLVECGLVSRITRSLDPQGTLLEGVQGGWSEANRYVIHDDGPVQVDRSNWCETCGSPFHSQHGDRNREGQDTRSGNRPNRPTAVQEQTEEGPVGVTGLSVPGVTGLSVPGVTALSHHREKKSSTRTKPSKKPQISRGASPPAPPFATEVQKVINDWTQPRPPTAFELEQWEDFRQLMSAPDEDLANQCGWNGVEALLSWSARKVEEARPLGTPARALDLTHPQTFKRLVKELRQRHSGPSIRERQVHAVVRWMEASS